MNEPLCRYHFGDTSIIYKRRTLQKSCLFWSVTTFVLLMAGLYSEGGMIWLMLSWLGTNLWIGFNSNLITPAKEDSAEAS